MTLLNQAFKFEVTRYWSYLRNMCVIPYNFTVEGGCAYLHSLDIYDQATTKEPIRGVEYKSLYFPLGEHVRHSHKAMPKNYTRVDNTIFATDDLILISSASKGLFIEFPGGLIGQKAPKFSDNASSYICYRRVDKIKFNLLRRKI